MTDVPVGSMEGGCQENITNMLEGVTKGANLPFDGHEEEDTYKNSDLRDQNSRKKIKKRTHKRLMKRSNKLKIGTQATRIFIKENKTRNLKAGFLKVGIMVKRNGQ